MKTEFYDQPRAFTVKGVTVRDMGKVSLAPDEMISFVTENGKEVDFTAKSWGFYVAPSVNGRLKNEGFKTSLVAGSEGKLYLMAVDNKKLDEFTLYINEQSLSLICWLDEWMSG